MTPPNTNDTPRTDAAAYLHHEDSAMRGDEEVDADFARTLERELNAVVQTKDEACRVAVENKNEADQLRTTNAALEKQVEELKIFIHEVGRGEHDSLLRRERDSFLAQLAECEKDKKRLDWLEKKTPLAIWAGSFSDSDYNISLGRVGAPICTISTMDDDGHEVDEEIAGGDSLRTAIDSAIAATKENK